jgi:LPXTG-motif cell wall-anchored protein
MAPLGTFKGTVSDALADAASVDNTACLGDNLGDIDAENDCATAAAPLMAAEPAAEVAVLGVMLEGPTETVAPTTAGDELADTGSDSMPLLLTGAALVAFGLAVMRLGRRREGDLN